MLFLLEIPPRSGHILERDVGDSPDVTNLNMCCLLLPFFSHLIHVPHVLEILQTLGIA